MHILGQIWNFFSSVKLAIFTLCALAGTSIIGTVVPQGESTTFYINNFGPKTAELFKILDIPNMYYSWWFLGLLGILSTNLIICSLDRFPAVWKIMSSDNLGISPDRLEKMANRAKWEFGTDKLSQLDLNELLKNNGWTASSQKNSENELFFAEKGKWSRTGVYIVHISILFIFAGATIGHFFGFKGSVMLPELQSTQKVFGYKNSGAMDLGFELRCNSFGIEFYENGMPKEYRSNLSVIENGEEVLNRDIEVNGPLSYKGFTFYQSSYQGYQDFLLNVKETDNGEAQTFSMPFQKKRMWQEKDLQFGIINAEAIGQRMVRAKLWFKAGENPATIEWLPDNSSLTIIGGSKKYTVSVKQMYATGLQVAKDPGVWIVYIGCAIMLVGLYMAFFMSHQRIWLYRRIESAVPELWFAGSSNKNKLAFVKVFNELKASIEHAVQR